MHPISVTAWVLKTYDSPLEIAYQSEKLNQRLLKLRHEIQHVLARERGVKVSYKAESSGKPFLMFDTRRSQVGISISRSQGFGLVAIAEDAEIGCDIEQIRPIAEWRVIGERYLAQSECAWLLQDCGADRDARFMRLWTLKEAYLKAVGVGLLAPLSSFEVAIGEWPCAALTKALGLDPGEAEWTLHSFQSGQDHVAAIAVKDHGAGVKFTLKTV